MSLKKSESHQRAIQAIAAAVRKSPVAGVHAASYLRAYFENVDAEDLVARDPRELAATALAHLKFARIRPRGRCTVRVFNPTVRECGYSSPHTVVEMVGEDMPFLVDSIGLAFQRRGLTMHFLAH
ncbi:MAG TPA: hypothetical protein VMU86_04300, partial [Steroidobacteraceae bacterium]|nr:hypothetical protein [Steroidobacteraceae bacterium]